MIPRPILHLDGTTARMWKRDGWRWVVGCFYSDDVLPPKQPRSLAIETRHKTDSSKDMEVSAGESRDDIGFVQVIRL